MDIDVERLFDVRAFAEDVGPVLQTRGDAAFEVAVQRLGHVCLSGVLVYVRHKEAFVFVFS